MWRWGFVDRDLVAQFGDVSELPLWKRCSVLIGLGYDMSTLGSVQVLFYIVE